MLGLLALLRLIPTNITPATYPAKYELSLPLQALYAYPVCTQKNLLWSCLNQKSCKGGNPFQRGDSWGCQRQYIGVAPADPTNAGAVAAATNFMSWASLAGKQNPSFAINSTKVIKRILAQVTQSLTKNMMTKIPSLNDCCINQRVFSNIFFNYLLGFSSHYKHKKWSNINYNDDDNNNKKKQQ